MFDEWELNRQFDQENFLSGSWKLEIRNLVQEFSRWFQGPSRKSQMQK